MKEFWKTGVALLLAGGLFAFYWFVERKQEPKPETESTKVTLLTVDKAKAKELKVAVKGGDSIALVKEGTFWKLTAPFAAPADTTAVESMFTSLEKLEADELVADQVKDFAQYGLDAPSRSVVAVVEGAQAPLAVDFGSKAPDGSSVYARKPGEAKVYLVPSWVEGSFDKKPFDLRDRDLLHVKRDDVRSLEVTGPEGGYALARSEAGEWAFTKPLQTRAGRWAVDGLLGTIEGLRMESVAGESVSDAKEVARYGFAKPTRTVTLVTKDGASRTLELGASAPDPNPSALADALALPLAREEGREAGAAQAHEVLRAPGGQRPRGRGAGGARRRPRQGHGGAACQAPARGRDLRDRGLRGDGRGRHEEVRQERDQGQGRPREDAVEAHRTGRQGARHHEGGGRALQDRRRRRERVRRRAQGARRLRPRRARAEGHAQGQGATPASSSARRTRATTPAAPATPRS